MGFFNGRKALARSFAQALHRVMAAEHSASSITQGFEDFPEIPQALAHIAERLCQLQALETEWRTRVAPPCSADQYNEMLSRLARQQAELDALQAQLLRTEDEKHSIKAQLDCLHSEENVWELMQQTLTEGCWDLQVNHGDAKHPDNVIRWSDQFRCLIGRTRSDFHDDWASYLAVIHPDDLDRVNQASSAYLAIPNNSAPYLIEYRMHHKTRGDLWFRERGRCVYDDKGVEPRLDTIWPVGIARLNPPPYVRQRTDEPACFSPHSALQSHV